MKHILITGSTDGIGKLAAIELAKKGHTLYLHGRNKEKLQQVIEEIKDATSNDNIDGFVADFSNLDKVKAMAQEVNEKASTLDVLINNAGVFNANQAITESGHDIRFVVNYFAPYMLTNSLIPLLKKSSEPRIINLSSAAQAPVVLEALKGEMKLSAQSAYAQSKLALTMWSVDLAKREQDMIVIPVNPGSLLNTKMVQEAYGQFWSSVDKGANILMELTENENLVAQSGVYFDNDQGRFAKAHEDAYDSNKTKTLIETTEDIING